MKKLMPKGFTIIEVIIVLVVGAVIMLSVFLVVPQLQRSSRNSQRQRDAFAMLVAANDYRNKGEVIPSIGISTSVTSNFTNYLPRSDFKDPSGSPYSIYVPTGNQSRNEAARITVGFDRACTSDKTATSTLLASSPGKIAVVMPLEPYGNSNRFCIDN